MFGNIFQPFTTMQEMNLDWILCKVKNILRFVPDDGQVGQILRRTRDGAAWSDEQGGGGGGAVNSVNGQTGDVVLDAEDVGALPDSYQAPVQSVNGQTGAVTINIPDSTSDLTNDSGFITAAQASAAAPVQSVNGQTGNVVIQAGGAVNSVNGHTGDVVLDAEDVGALADTLPHIVEIGSAAGGWSWTLYSDNTIDLYLYVEKTLTNYAATSFGGLYQFGYFDLPVTMELGYAFIAGCKVGNGMGIVALCNPVSGSQIDVVAQSNYTGTYNCSVSVHLHGKKAV